MKQNERSAGFVASRICRPRDYRNRFYFKIVAEDIFLIYTDHSDLSLPVHAKDWSATDPMVWAFGNPKKTPILIQAEQRSTRP